MKALESTTAKAGVKSARLLGVSFQPVSFSVQLSNASPACPEMPLKALPRREDPPLASPAQSKQMVDFVLETRPAVKWTSRHPPLTGKSTTIKHTNLFGFIHILAVAIDFAIDNPNINICRCSTYFVALPILASSQMK